MSVLEFDRGKTYTGKLMSMINPLSLLSARGKNAEAEAISRRTLELRKTVSGKDHSSWNVNEHNNPLDVP